MNVLSMRCRLVSHVRMHTSAYVSMTYMTYIYNAVCPTCVCIRRCKRHTASCRQLHIQIHRRFLRCLVHTRRWRAGGCVVKHVSS